MGRPRALCRLAPHPPLIRGGRHRFRTPWVRGSALMPVIGGSARHGSALPTFGRRRLRRQQEDSPEVSFSRVDLLPSRFAWAPEPRRTWLPAPPWFRFPHAGVGDYAGGRRIGLRFPSLAFISSPRVAREHRNQGAYGRRNPTVPPPWFRSAHAGEGDYAGGRRIGLRFPSLALISFPRVALERRNQGTRCRNRGTRAHATTEPRNHGTRGQQIPRACPQKRRKGRP